MKFDKKAADAACGGADYQSSDVPRGASCLRDARGAPALLLMAPRPLGVGTWMYVYGLDSGPTGRFRYTVEAGDLTGTRFITAKGQTLNEALDNARVHASTALEADARGLWHCGPRNVT